MKACLTFFLALRLLELLKISFSVNFFLKFFRSYFRKFMNIYLLITTAILCMSIYVFTTSNNFIFPSLFESIVFSRNAMYSSTDSRMFYNSSNFELFGNFIFLMIFKAFVFSTVIAGFKEIYDEESENEKKFLSKYKNKIIGDYIYFIATFIFKLLSGYLFLEFRYLTKLDEEILYKLKKGLSSIEKIQDIDKIQTFTDLKKKHIEILYSYFRKDKKEFNFINYQYFLDLNENYKIEKIELGTRDVYLIVKKSKNEKKNLNFNYV